MVEKSDETEMSVSRAVLRSPKREIVIFLVLTFALTYLLNLVMWLNFSLIGENLLVLALATRVQTIIPAFSAIFLNLFLFKTKNYSRKSKILFYYFLVLVALFVLVFVVWLVYPIDIASVQIESIENLVPILAMSVLNLVTLVLLLGWIVLVFYWNLKSASRKELKATKLSFGKPSYYLLFTLFFFGYFLLSTTLDWIFNLGNPPSEPVEPIGLLLGFATIFLGPVLSFPQLFGEEYGWRIFLQDRLAQIYSRFKAVLIVGLVWGLWHVPLIILEAPYSNNLVLGIGVYTISTILLSIPLGLAVFKSRSVWLATYLHGIINGSVIYFTTHFYDASDPVYSFVLGIFGLLVFGTITLIFLKSKDWKQR